MGSQALFAALEMGVFDAVAARGSASVADVQAEVGVEAPRLQTLLTALVTLGALRRDDATHAYALSPNAARFLVRDAPDFYGDYLQLQARRPRGRRRGSRRRRGRDASGSHRARRRSAVNSTKEWAASLESSEETLRPRTPRGSRIPR